MEFFPDFEKTFNIALKKITASEWAGPCPVCGGNDRFRLWPDNTKKGGFRWLCRQCGKYGDVIDLYRAVKNCGYAEACKSLALDEKTPGPDNKQKIVKNSFPARETDFIKWNSRARSFLSNCQTGYDVAFDNDYVPSEKVVTELITGRCLNLQTLLACGIGYNEKTRYEPRDSWGLKSDPKHQKIKIPKGIVIATRRKNIGVVAITIRLPAEDIEKGGPKYWQIAGSLKDVPYVCGKPGTPVVIVESALDAALVWQYGKGKFSAVAIMGATKNLDESTRQFIASAPVKIIAYDKDNPGREAAIRLEAIFKGAKLIPSIDAKDLGEMNSKFWRNEGGMYLADWLEVVLKI